MVINEDEVHTMTWFLHSIQAIMGATDAQSKTFDNDVVDCQTSGKAVPKFEKKGNSKKQLKRNDSYFIHETADSPPINATVRNNIGGRTHKQSHPGKPVLCPITPAESVELRQHLTEIFSMFDT